MPACIHCIWRTSGGVGWEQSQHAPGWEVTSLCHMMAGNLPRVDRVIWLGQLGIYQIFMD